MYKYSHDMHDGHAGRPHDKDNVQYASNSMPICNSIDIDPSATRYPPEAANLSFGLARGSPRSVGSIDGHARPIASHINCKVNVGGGDETAIGDMGSRDNCIGADRRQLADRDRWNDDGSDEMSIDQLRQYVCELQGNLRVRFNDCVEMREIPAYSETYGVHPREFNFAMDDGVLVRERAVPMGDMCAPQL